MKTILIFTNWAGLGLSLDTLPAWLAFATVIVLTVESVRWAES